MTLASLILVLLIEQWRPLADRRAVTGSLARYARFLQKHFNAGESQHGVIAWILGVVPALALAGLAFWLLAGIHPILGLAFNVAVLYATMGFRQASHYFTAIQTNIKEGELDRARDVLAQWRGRSSAALSRENVIRLTIEQALAGSHRYLFGVIFWYVVLPGPTGAILYRIAAFLHSRWGDVEEQEFGRFGWFAREAFYLIDWIPARMAAIAFAIVGNFEDAIYCWRAQAARWKDRLLGVVLASGAGAIGVRLGNPLPTEEGSIIDRPELGTGDDPDAPALDSTVGLLWRALMLWLAAILIVTIVRALS
ncbi:MAG: CobD/CbiB family protein [Betaproteobacteria bacterium]|nr:CobD/CbiB family protein [Betaproteobacteria bacterium]